MKHYMFLHQKNVACVSDMCLFLDCDSLLTCDSDNCPKLYKFIPPCSRPLGS